MAKDNKSRSPLNDPHYKGKPIDPTYDYEEAAGETEGKAGITTNRGPSDTAKAILERDKTSDSPENLVSTRSAKVVSEVNHLADSNDVEEKDYVYLGDEKASPEQNDELSEMGEMSDLESDDDQLEASHLVGLRLDETPEHPKELNTAADVAAAEKARRTVRENPPARRTKEVAFTIKTPPLNSQTVSHQEAKKIDKPKHASTDYGDNEDDRFKG